MRCFRVTLIAEMLGILTTSKTPLSKENNLKLSKNRKHRHPSYFVWFGSSPYIIREVYEAYVTCAAVGGQRNTVADPHMRSFQYLRWITYYLSRPAWPTL